MRFSAFHFLFLVSIPCVALRAQPANNAAFGSTVMVWSSHTTVRERVDAGDNERIEIWSRTWIVSPSGQTYANTNNYGLGGTDGSSTTTVTLNEVGRWSFWLTDGGAIDSFTYGDGPSSWYMFPHNPPNGVGYGGAGTQLGSYIDVQAATTYSLTTSVSGSGTVSGGGSYTAGSSAAVTATPDSGYTFSGWQGALSGTANPATLTMDSDKSVTAVFTALNRAPTIAWTSTPGTVASGANYTVSAHGHDDDGNLTQVNIWKSGVGFAFAGGGNGTDGDSGNATSDTGPATITFTAQAVDGNGATSATITQTVTVTAANQPPTIAWNTTPGSVASGQSYTVSAHGHDADGNLTQVNVWKSGVAFAFAGGGNGTDGDSGNTTSDTGPATITFTAQAVDGNGATSATITQTVTVTAANQAPTIAWNTTPGSVASGQSYTVSAHGHDADGNLTQVNVWKNGVAFAFAGGGNGTDGDSVNTSSDTGPATITFTAQAVDGNGATSATITQTVTVATANQAPTIAWNTTPGSVASGQSYTVSAHGHDADGNLTQVNVWKNGVAFAFAGGGNGTDGDSSNTTSDTGPATITFTAQAVDAAGATSSTITQTVTVAAPASVSASISANPTSTNAPGSTTITWSSVNATSVAVSGTGLNSTAATGTQTVTGLAEGTHIYTITAQGNGGPVTQTATVTVAAPASVTASITASPASASAPGSSTITWSSANATSVSVTGNGLNSTAASGSQSITGLAAGSYDYTITAQGPNGPATQTATVTVAPASSVTGSISASPTTGTEPASTTITWNTSNASSVAVTGPGLNSTASSGSQSVTGLTAGTHVFSLTAQGNGGPITQTATVTVTPLASVSGSITASPTTGIEPASTTITWNTANASSVSVTGPGLSSVAASGSQSVTALAAGTHTFTMTAQGPGGPITRTAIVTVSAAVPNVSGSINASPTTVTAPGATTITWSTANASSVWVSGPGLASAAASGTQNVTGLSAGTHTFTLTAQGNGGPVTRTAIVNVNAGAGVTASMSVSPPTMNWGGTATLTWFTTNATSVRVTGYGITGSPYQTSPNLTVNVGGLPPGESTWTLVAEGPGGPITRTATITVNSTDGLYGSLTTSPTVIYSNQSATLAWTSTGANFKWVHGQSPGYNGVNVYPAPTSGSTTVSGLAPGEYSFVFEYGPGAFSATRIAFAYLTVLGVDRTVATSVAPAGTGAVTGGGTYREGSSVKLTATPDATHVFSGWSGDFTGTTNPLTFTIGAQNYSVVANFALRTYSVAATASPAGAGSITGAGSYNAGSTATLTATPDATHSFIGWTGDMVSAANPLTFLVNGNVNLTANFAATSFVLTTAATTGGSVTPGGTYPAGTLVTITATPDATHRFIDWTGDASGTASTTGVTLDRDKFAQANFSAKLPQSIAFTRPADRGLGSPPFALDATASSGLPVTFSLLSGPAILTGNSVEVTGAGPITLQANQAGDALYLPAAPAVQSFNVIAAATLKYRGQSRTLLGSETTRETPPFVLEKP